MVAKPAVVVDGLQKHFRLPTEQTNTLKERALHPFRRTSQRTLSALEGVSFTVDEGEFFGIVGRNGSGKSTLLKCLAGIYRADAGTAAIGGRLSTFIELGVGFNMDLAARDNIRINAVMLGLSGRQAREREDEIIHFAGLEQFEQLKIKNYSSGMLVRLGFSIMAHVDADVLLIDEVLAVGDAAFQQKCFDQFDRVRREGRTVLFVTHDMSAVRRYCDRAILLDGGRIIAEGDPEHIGEEYLRVNFASEDLGEAAPSHDAGDEDDTEHREGDGSAEILSTWFEDEHGAPVEVLPHGHPCAIATRVRFHETVTDPRFGAVLLNGLDVPVFGATNGWNEPHSGTFTAGEEIVFRVRFDNVLAPGRYHATPAIAHAGTGAAWIDRRVRFASVVVSGILQVDTAVLLPFDLDIDRVDQPARQQAQA